MRVRCEETSRLRRRAALFVAMEYVIGKSASTPNMHHESLTQRNDSGLKGMSAGRCSQLVSSHCTRSSTKCTLYAWRD